jgi:uncharacterized membrane protein YdjX (TVP38/TMEM64 family)
MEDRLSRSEKKTTTRERGATKASRLKLLFILLVLLALPAIWRWTPLNEWINFGTISAWQQSMRDNPAAIFLVAAIYVLGGLVFFPVTILTLATVFTYGPIAGNVYATAGWLFSAAVSYGIGRRLGGELLHKLAGPRLDGLIQQAGRHGFFTVLTMRIVPVAPFTLVNLFVGASWICFRDFFLASLVGRIPGMVALTLFGFQLESLLHRPGVQNLFLLGFVLALIFVAGVWLTRRFESGARRSYPSKS